jgi:two-component system, sensor histidine kinase PdtaS
MATLAELARAHTDLTVDQVDHLQRLLASWGPLADLCFADLLLLVPVSDAEGELVVVGQQRPTTAQTVYRTDMVGEVLLLRDRPLVEQAWRTRNIVDGDLVRPGSTETTLVRCIPVRAESEVIAVVSRESALTTGREAGELERAYLRVFDRFAAMIAAGTFPFAVDDVVSGEVPRVGDGVIVLDSEERVEYASPNAVSALHRLGVHANAEAMRLGDVGLDDEPIKATFAMGAPVTEEVERGPDITVLVRALPLLDHDEVVGAVVMLRDISELRRRDRLLVSMDASIREIHHRVKNNLQTISSLLRLQARRLEMPEARDALEESVRRVRSIALVHETLSRDAGDDVMFNEIVRPLVRMVEESLRSPDRAVNVTVEGEAGLVPAEIATPLAVVLTELVQNAVDHGYPESEGGLVRVGLDNDGETLTLTVADDGAGLPPGFRLDDSTGLGLSIVRSLVESQLEGRLTMQGRHGEGTTVEVRIPIPADEGGMLGGG